MSSIAQADVEAKNRLTAFLEGRANKVTRPE
jgi:(methylthio)acryloyl-CoA hydratase